MRLSRSLAVVVAIAPTMATVRVERHQPMAHGSAVRTNAASIVVEVREFGTNAPVVHPMVCVKEFGQPLGAIGDSLGMVHFGGNLAPGTLHLGILAPSHFPVDTTAMWPPQTDRQVLRVAMRPGQRPTMEPRCD